MTTVNAHFDGKNFVPDEPVPSGLVANAKVRVVCDVGNTAEVANDTGVLFDALLGLAGPSTELPKDFAAQHEHYVKGTPKR